MTKLGALRVDFVGDSKDLVAAAATAKASLASVGKQTELVAQKQTKATGNTLKFGNRLGDIGKKSGLAKGGLRNLTFQLQDIIVQMQMGTRMSTIMSQQLPQLGASFGSVGLIIFSVAGALAAVGGLMLATNGEAETLEKGIENLEESMKAYIKTSGDANLTTEEMIEKFGSASTAVREVLAELAKLDGAATASQIETMISALIGFAEVEDRINASLIAQKLGLTSFFKPFISLTKETKDQVIDLADAYARFANARETSEKISAAQSLQSQFVALAEINGEITAEEEEQIRALSEIVIKLNESTLAASGIKTELQQASEFMGAMAQSAGDAADELARFRAVQASLGSGPIGAGRGGAPIGESGAVRQVGGEFIVPDPKKATKKSPLERDLESLKKNLATELELELEHFDNAAETLRSALENELITRQKFEELTERSKEEHLKRMEDLDKTSKKNQINLAQSIFGNLAGLMNSNSKKLFKIGKVAAIGESLIATYKAATKALAEVPYPFNFVAAAAVAAAGLANVAKIQSTQFGGGGGASVGSGSAGGAVAGGAAGAGGGRTSFVGVDLQGEGSIGRGQVRDLISLINDEIEDGAVLGGITVN